MRIRSWSSYNSGPQEFFLCCSMECWTVSLIYQKKNYYRRRRFDLGRDRFSLMWDCFLFGTTFTWFFWDWSLPQRSTLKIFSFGQSSFWVSWGGSIGVARRDIASKGFLTFVVSVCSCTSRCSIQSSSSSRNQSSLSPTQRPTLSNFDPERRSARPYFRY